MCRIIKRRNLAWAQHNAHPGLCEWAWAHQWVWIKHVIPCSPPVSVSFPANAMGPCLVRLRCCGTRRAGLPQWRHRRGSRQLQPIVVERTSAWRTGSLPFQLCHTGAPVRVPYAPAGCIRAALLTWPGQRGSESSLAPRTYGVFAFVLIYWELIFWNAGKKQNPLKRVGFFFPFCTSIKG